jgi:hypothetical protein
MRAEGLADNEIAGLFRHAADQLDAATKESEVEPSAQTKLSNLQQLRCDIAGDPNDKLLYQKARY